MQSDDFDKDFFLPSKMKNQLLYFQKHTIQLLLLGNSYTVIIP